MSLIQSCSINLAIRLTGSNVNAGEDCLKQVRNEAPLDPHNTSDVQLQREETIPRHVVKLVVQFSLGQPKPHALILFVALLGQPPNLAMVSVSSHIALFHSQPLSAFCWHHAGDHEQSVGLAWMRKNRQLWWWRALINASTHNCLSLDDRSSSCRPS